MLRAAVNSLDARKLYSKSAAQHIHFFFSIPSSVAQAAIFSHPLFSHKAVLKVLVSKSADRGIAVSLREKRQARKSGSANEKLACCLGDVFILFNLNTTREAEDEPDR